MKRTILFITIFYAALTALVPPARTFAADQVVTNCTNDVELRADLTAMQSSGGGTLTFNCGASTITLSSLLPQIVQDTVIDGGAKITLSGNDAVSMFLVGASGKLILKNIQLERAYKENGDGGAIVNFGHLTVDNATIRQSITHVPYYGGAIVSYGPLQVRNSTFAKNIAGYGGAIYASDIVTSFTLKITNSKFIDNSGSMANAGGAIFSAVPFDISSSEFVRNKAGSGGAIYEQSLTGSTISESYFERNEAMGTFPYGRGGALYVDGTSVKITNITLQNNKARYGGGIFLAPEKNLLGGESTLTENEAIQGGGIYVGGAADLANVTLSGNKVSNMGGGMFVYRNGAARLVNATLSGNSAQNLGGGVYMRCSNTHPRDLERQLGTLERWGVAEDNARTYLFNTLIAHGAFGTNCYLVPGGYQSLSDDNSCNFGAGRDGVDLKLAPLAKNGGKTQTHLPLAGSPAFDDAVDINCPPTDQRGIMRPQGAKCDIGAVEVVPGSPTPTATATRTATKTATPTTTPTVQPCQGKPAKPILLKPGNAKKVKKLTPKLDWEDAQCALKYKVKIRLDSPTGARFQKKGGLTVSEFRTKELSQGQTYAWHVIAINGAGKTKSEWWTFKSK